MSTLTDLFTSMANKIRSKTGTQTTYTPAEMASDGIDDVYDAGYAAGGGGSSATSITPSNSSPVSLRTDEVYQPTSGGYAIESYNNAIPSNSSPVSVSNGGIYKMGGDGKLVQSVSNLTPSDSSPEYIYTNSIYKPTTGGYAIASEPVDITPSNSSPASMNSGGIYKPSSSGYAISSYSSVSPSSSGTYFSSGMKKMSSSGYAYSSKPQMTETTLWTNSSPTSSFASQTVTLSQDMDNFNYLKVTVRASTASDKRIGVIIPVSDFKNTVTTGQGASLGICGGNSGAHARRAVAYTSDTQVWFSNAGSGGSSYNNTAIPVSISGLKY